MGASFYYSFLTAFLRFLSRSSFSLLLRSIHSLSTSYTAFPSMINFVFMSGSFILYWEFPSITI